MEYIMTELLKNAYRASVEHHIRTDASGPIPPVIITIAQPPAPIPTSPDSPPSPPAFMGLRIRDQGGGVAPADSDRIFTYAFTTAGRSDGNDSDSDDDAGGPYAAQHVGGLAGIGDSHDTGGRHGAGSGNVFGEITGKGMQVGIGTLAGLGYGCVYYIRKSDRLLNHLLRLPLARLYATFFGGNLELKSLHGHGVDVFLNLRNLRPELGDVEI